MLPLIRVAWFAPECQRSWLLFVETFLIPTTVFSQKLAWFAPE